MSTKSGLKVASRSNASSALAAVRKSYPWSASKARTSWTFIWLSSTSNTDLFSMVLDRQGVISLFRLKCVSLPGEHAGKSRRALGFDTHIASDFHLAAAPAASGALDSSYPSILQSTSINDCAREDIKA